MKLLLDENLSPVRALRLRDAGRDAVAVLDAGLGGADDAVIRQFALEQERTLVTTDSDFSHIVRYPPESTPGVIWLRPWPPTETMIETLLAGALRQFAGTSVAGKLVAVEPGRFSRRLRNA